MLIDTSNILMTYFAHAFQSSNFSEFIFVFLYAQFEFFSKNLSAKIMKKS